MKDQSLLVRKILKSLWFITTHTNQIRKYRLKSFGRPSNEQRFQKDQQSNQNQTITVEDYFQMKWKIRLKYPQLPVVELFNPIDKDKSHFLPMELVSVDQWQRSLKPLTTEQRVKVTKKTVIQPGARYGIIQRIVDERGFDKDSYLKKFGIQIHAKEMLEISARILSPPEIKYKSSQGDGRDFIERVQFGKWYLNHRLNQTRQIRHWALVLVSQREPEAQQVGMARDFGNKISQVNLSFSFLFK